jgi:signal transduction histidine kinase
LHLEEDKTHNNVSSTTRTSSLSSETIEIIRDNPKKALELELKLISSAVSTIELIFSSTKVFRIQQRLGTIQALEDVLAKNTVSARILMPKADAYSEEDFQRLEKINGLNVRCFNYNSDIRNKTLIVDRAESLVIEIKEEEGEGEEEEKILGNATTSRTKTKSEAKQELQQQQREKEIISFNKIIGLSTYSNSRSTVLSYAAMFETLWNETELYEQIRQSHEKLEIANEQLEREYKNQSDFVNIAAHEIRTPAQSILGYAEMLDTENTGSKEYVIPILRNAERLRRLTEDILHLAKIESQTLKLNKEQFNLGKAVLSVAQDIINKSGRYNGKKANVCFFGGCCEGGAEEDTIVVEADRGRIMQVISNILSNAIRFAKEGEVIVSIERKDRIIDSNGSKSNNDNDNDINNNKGDVIVSVKDTGTGIDPDVLPKLFSKFAVTSDTGGTGLGLFISKSIIEAHGGRIWAENNANGEGATFSFSLPINT